MNKMKKLVPIFLLLCLFVFKGCSEQSRSEVDSNPGNVVIGTFNVEWLGDGVRDRVKRTEKDYSNISKIIKKTGADIMALQEVENSKAMKRLLKYLPGYKFYISNSGSAQKLAVVYKNTVKMDLKGDYNPLIVKKRRTRPGLLFDAKKGNFDFKVMVVHFKSTSHWDNTPEKRAISVDLRRQQAEKVADWVNWTLKNRKEEDLIVVGDFNDTPQRKKEATLTPMEKRAGLIFLTRDMKSCKFSSWFAIDHIAVTKSASLRFTSTMPQVLDVHTLFSKAEAEKISDHCPIYAEFEVISPDND